MGLIVPRFQSTAVARNRLRRQLREIWRRDIRPGLASWDVVVKTRPEAYEAEFSELRGALLAWRQAVSG